MAADSDRVSVRWHGEWFSVPVEALEAGQPAYGQRPDGTVVALPPAAFVGLPERT